ncbi:CvpA family protein [Desulfohalobium retbaense]|jgi:membrane protein required for colicin V production|uniref:Colicin V production protein n=1 Tax=Desulfohalobium retbaense (strain ATCC 49708 / DSM 5692 / JCM 16813 / HR100) TaxID=485915 RepID=C8X4Y1_DESRD|nr:CvpA family protein [Desulfohalobium retbaense]ACV69478.1 Colicin V production protein [Desulfohalobium retbaense DSM 5692]
MNGLDIFFLLVLVLGLVRGLFRGLIRELTSILSLIAGFFAANTYYPVLEPYLKPLLPNPPYTQIVSYTLILLTVIAAVFFIGSAIRKLLHITLLGGVDRILGGISGLVKAGLLCSIVLFVMTTFLPDNTPVLRDSQTAPYVHRFTSTVTGLIPDDLRETFDQKSQSLQQSWQEHWLQKLRDTTPKE